MELLRGRRQLAESHYLLCGGTLYNSSLRNAGSEGSYWSSTPYNSNGAYYLGFNSGYVYYSSSRYDGLSVRCVAAG